MAGAKRDVATAAAARCRKSRRIMKCAECEEWAEQRYGRLHQFAWPAETLVPTWSPSATLRDANRTTLATGHERDGFYTHPCTGSGLDVALAHA